jgi:hypothetical protein
MNNTSHVTIHADPLSDFFGAKKKEAENRHKILLCIKGLRM